MLAPFWFSLRCHKSILCPPTIFPYIFEQSTSEPGRGEGASAPVLPSHLERWARGSYFYLALFQKWAVWTAWIGGTNMSVTSRTCPRTYLIPLFNDILFRPPGSESSPYHHTYKSRLIYYPQPNTYPTPLFMYTISRVIFLKIEVVCDVEN